MQTHHRVYFGRPESGTLEVEFSGNLTEVCPTGVFTDKTHSERYNRKWDMQYAPSVCQGCSSGCKISPVKLMVNCAVSKTVLTVKSTNTSSVTKVVSVQVM